MSKTYVIRCRGRDDRSDEVLDDSVKARIIISKRRRSNDISINVDCPYNTGSHGQRCKASHLNIDKIGEGVLCPYSVDLPYAFDNFKLEPRAKK